MKTRIIVFLCAIIIISFFIMTLINNKAANKIETTKTNILNVAPVNVIQTIKEDLNEPLSFVGTITAYNDVAIVSETQGRVIEVFGDVGDSKASGSVLIKVDDELKHANFKMAENNYNKAKKDWERFKKLFESNSASDQQVEMAELAFKTAEAQYIVARRQYTDTQITTPISGVITARMVDVGTMINIGKEVANIADISRLKVKLNLSESDAFKIKTGDKVKIRTDVYPDFEYDGKIKSISDKADEIHTYPVEINMSNNKLHPLKAGMFGRVSFTSINNGASIMIPREAIIGSIKNPQVFAVKDNLSQLRNIVTGIEIGTKVQVLSGLEENETIVINGQNNIKDGDRVTIVK